MFVTSVVVAGVLIMKPHKIARWPFLRDTFFYLIALGWLAFTLLYGRELYVWEPLGLMGDQ